MLGARWISLAVPDRLTRVAIEIGAAVTLSFDASARLNFTTPSKLLLPTTGRGRC